MSAPPPQPYPGMYYAPMSLDNFLSRRNLFYLNALGLGAIWIGYLIAILATPTDTGMHSLARFVIVTFGFLAVAATVAGALGSKKTSDTQTMGLFIWAGLLLISVIFSVIFAGTL